MFKKFTKEELIYMILIDTLIQMGYDFNKILDLIVKHTYNKEVNKMNKQKDLEEKEAKDINDVLPNLFRDIPLLDTVIGDKEKLDVTIQDLYFENTSFGEYAVFTFANGKKYRTCGKIAVDQAHKIVEMLPLKVHLALKESKEGTYITLTG